MRLFFERSLAREYTSLSQKARILTEQWVNEQAYCPNCGHLNVNKYGNNKPVADFFCPNCSEEYELKSKKEAIGVKIVNGAYRTMIGRLESRNNPNLFLLSYDFKNYEVVDFFVIPKHFFVPEIIEKRRPLALTARRAGWVGCNILLSPIPQAGKIFLIRNKQVASKQNVLAEWKKTIFLREERDISVKSWLLDIMRCIENLGKRGFTLSDMYFFERELSRLHPENKHIKDKIRQQLQLLRDRGYLNFMSRGRYELI